MGNGVPSLRQNTWPPKRAPARPSTMCESGHSLAG